MLRLDFIEAPDGARAECLTEDEARAFVIAHTTDLALISEARHPQSGIWACDARSCGFKLGVWHGDRMAPLEGEVTMVRVPSPRQ